MERGIAGRREPAAETRGLHGARRSGCPCANGGYTCIFNTDYITSNTYLHMYVEEMFAGQGRREKCHSPGSPPELPPGFLLEWGFLAWPPASGVCKAVEEDPVSGSG